VQALSDQALTEESFGLLGDEASRTAAQQQQQQQQQLKLGSVDRIGDSHGQGGSVAEWLACWTQAQKGPGSNRSRDAVG